MTLITLPTKQKTSSRGKLKGSGLAKSISRLQLSISPTEEKTDGGKPSKSTKTERRLEKGEKSITKEKGNSLVMSMGCWRDAVITDKGHASKYEVLYKSGNEDVSVCASGKVLSDVDTKVSPL